LAITSCFSGIMVKVDMAFLTMTIWKVQMLHGHGHSRTSPPPIYNEF
jgi:hypothetical protein